MSHNEANVTSADKLSGQRFLCSIIYTMNIKYFQDTDTLYIEFKAAEVAASKDLDENTVLDLDQSGNILGITVEHASQRADIPRFSYEQIAA
jgi:uncharacterized protein YuzE